MRDLWRYIIAGMFAALLLAAIAGAATAQERVLPPQCVSVADAIICGPQNAIRPPDVLCFPLEKAVVGPDGRGYPVGTVFCGFGAGPKGGPA